MFDTRLSARSVSLWRSALEVLRSFGHAKGFAVAAVVTVALGIGVNSVVFSLFDRLLFRPLPYEEPDRLVQLYSIDSSTTRRYPTLHAAVMLELARETDLFSGVAWAAGGDLVPMAPVPGENPLLWLTGVTTNTLDVLGVGPVIGPGFSGFPASALERPVLLTYDVWQGRFGGSENVLSLGWTARDAAGEDVLWRVVGVLPKGFILPSPRLTSGEFDGIYGTEPGFDRQFPMRAVGVAPFARLAPGVSIAEARARARTIVASRFPGLTNYLTYERTSISVVPLQSGHASAGRSHAWFAVLGAWAVLGITCVTLGILLLTWSQSRRHDTGVRLALGASPRRLVIGALIESLVLCAVGAAIGLLGYAWTRSLFAGLLPASLQTYAAETADVRVVVVTCGIAAISAVAAAVLPAVRTTRVSPLVALRADPVATEYDRLAGGPILLAVQAALGVVLVVGAAVTLPTVVRALWEPPGFNATDLYTVHVPTANDRTAADAREQVRRGREALEAARALPGVVGAALAQNDPLWPGSIEEQRLRRMLNDDGSSPLLQESRAVSSVGRIVPVDGGFFATIGTPLLAGRTFSPAEIEEQALVAVINEAQVKLLAPGSSAVQMPGRTVTTENGPRTIIGVAADFQVGMDPWRIPTVFVPLSANEAYAPLRNNPYPYNSFALVLRMAPGRVPDVALLSDRVRTLPWALPGWIGARRESVAQQIGLDMAAPRLLALIFGTLGAITLLLTVVAIHGIASFEIRRRREELTVRMALGATPGLLRRRLAIVIVRPVALGLLVGLPVSWVAAMLLSRSLTDLDATDPWAYVAAAAIILTAAVAAAWIPGRRHLTMRVGELLRSS